MDVGRARGRADPVAPAETPWPERPDAVEADGQERRAALKGGHADAGHAGGEGHAAEHGATKKSKGRHRRAGPFKIARQKAFLGEAEKIRNLVPEVNHRRGPVVKAEARGHHGLRFCQR